MNTVVNNGTVEFTGSGNQSMAAPTNGGSANLSVCTNLVLSGGGVKSLANPTSVSGTITLNSDTTLNTGTSSFTVSAASANSIAGVITGSGQFIKTGAGTLTLSAASGNNTAHTYTGATTISAVGSGTINVTGLNGITVAALSRGTQVVTFSSVTPANGTYKLLPSSLVVSTQSFSHNADASKVVTFDYATSTVTVISATITTATITPTTYCVGDAVTVTFTSNTVLSGTYTAQLSDVAGSFSAPVNIGSSSTATILATVPNSTPTGSGYRIRVVNIGNTIVGSDNGSDLTINQPTLPVFTAVAPICAGASLSPLPTTSNNGYAGTWAPALNSMATTTYTFTPTSGQCATTATLTITVNPILTPTFTAVDPICAGAVLNALPTVSNNGYTGTWSPALNNMATTTYTFTPSIGECATTTTLTIVVNQNITPLFAAVPDFCLDELPVNPLPTTSLNGYTGTWSPAFNPTATTTYTFTPTPGQCATTATLTIAVATTGCESVVNLKVFIQGYYDELNPGMMKSVKFNQDNVSPLDEVEDLTVELYDSLTLDLVTSTTATLKTDGTLECIFDDAQDGSFYIVVKGSNLVETWSAAPQAVGSTQGMPLDYDFTSSESQSFTDNSQPSVVEVEPGIWAFYSGDINQDEIVDSGDVVDVANDSDVAEFGVIVTDITGDGVVDSFDFSMVSNNSDAVIYTQRP